MSHKIIKPEGIELIEYLNNGYNARYGTRRYSASRMQSLRRTIPVLQNVM